MDGLRSVARLPEWARKGSPLAPDARPLRVRFRDQRLTTVCEEARCPTSASDSPAARPRSCSAGTARVDWSAVKNLAFVASFVTAPDTSRKRSVLGMWRIKSMKSAGVLTAILLLGGPTSDAGEVDQNKRVVRRLYDELFSKWNLAIIDELIAPDFVGHEMPPGMPRGPEGFRQFYAGIRAGLPDVQLTVEDMIGEGDKVVVRWRGRATHRGDFLGIPPTGKTVSFTGIAIYRLSNGKVVERWVEVDLLGVMGQLRATAAPPGN